MKALRALFFVLVLLAFPSLACAGGALRGTISSEQGGDRLSGANVLLLGTAIGATTDLDGEYRTEEVPAGTYEVRASFEGYDSKVLPNVVITDGKTTRLDIKLARRGGAASFTIDDLVVTADRVMSTEVALITERMKSITIGDAISAERISKSPDASGSDVLKRVTGLQVVDGKYVFVRGMPDRYNTTWLDGVSITSTDTDVDRKSFAFDMIPSYMLSSAVIVKSGSPDLPGDFAGGLVQLNTRDIPTERKLSLSVAAGYDEGTTFNDMTRTLGGGTDHLAMDDGTRDIPDFVPPNSGNNYNALAYELDNSWVTRRKEAPVNSSYTVSYGDRFDIGENDGRHVIGVIFGGKYSQGYDIAEQRETSTAASGYTNYQYEGKEETYSVTWSGLLNVAYSPVPGHQFTARAIKVQDAEDQYATYTGQLSENNGSGGDSYQYEWDERSRLSTQVGGTHEFGRRLRGPRFEWKVFGSDSDAHEPDRKQADYYNRAGGVQSMAENTHSWTDLDEKGVGGKADFTLPLGWLGTTEVKAGLYIEQREREYTTDAYWTDLTTVRSPNYWIRVLDVEDIHEPEHYGSRKLTLRVKSAYTGEYEGKQDIEAYYAMINHPFEVFRQSFRFSGGARVEHSLQRVEAIQREGDQEPIVSEIDKTDVLPSVNLTYMPTEWANVRVGHYVSVNRPELREMGAIKYRDFNANSTVQGNPDLERSVIRSYDLRVEAFPGAGEVLAVSYFYKDLKDAIEEKFIPSSDYRHIRTWFNSEEAINHGFEIEIKKELGFVHRWLDDLGVAFNYTRAFSSVDYLYEWREEVEPGVWVTHRETKTRLLQGQAPWAINVSVTYANEDIGTTASLLYNNLGRSLDKASLDPPDRRYKESRPLLDIAVTQKLPLGLQMKLTGKNITGEPEVYTQGDHAAESSYEEANPVWSLSLSARL
jgi:TonB-dependent receptor